MQIDPQDIMRNAIQCLGPNLRPRTTENGFQVTNVAERIETESAISSFLSDRISYISLVHTLQHEVYGTYKHHDRVQLGIERLVKCSLFVASWFISSSLLPSCFESRPLDINSDSILPSSITNGFSVEKFFSLSRGSHLKQRALWKIVVVQVAYGRNCRLKWLLQYHIDGSMSDEDETTCAVRAVIENAEPNPEGTENMRLWGFLQALVSLDAHIPYLRLLVE
ncbi:hypothetical protein E6O75_ATG03851 [Venturia nashicola]|uniref:Uncharacterized protein n=1 Tax=Venturia nashicola TaxID=86259 RepID=A0A4Z1PC80_9PEZI|nr:hypothetical protein E6O75_ATG03851 [Venturia nashicola]